MGIGKLTQDRTNSSGYTATFLNEVYKQFLDQFSILPNGLINDNGDLINTDLDESDAWSAGIETPEDIAELIAYFGMTYNIIEPDEETGSNLNSDASWIATWVYDLIEKQDGSTDITKNTVVTIYDYLENQYASGIGLGATNLGSGQPPLGREQATFWVNQATRLADNLKDLAMNYGNQYIQGGAVYNTARVGNELTLTQAVANANQVSSQIRASQVTQGQFQNLAFTSQLVPFQQQQQYQLTSGGGNSQPIPALNGGNASPFTQLKGFTPAFANSLSPQNSSVQTLSYQGEQQQFSFNEEDAKTPVYHLFNGLEQRTQLGSFKMKFSLNTGLTMVQNEYTPDNTAIGGYSGTLYAIEDFQSADYYIPPYNAITVGLTLSFEGFEEFSKDYSDNSAWGVAEPYQISFENFSTGFTEGARPETDKPSNCGGIESGDQVFGENLTSQVNGSNVNFVVSTSFVSGSLRVYRNGQRMTDTQITETGRSTFSTSDLLSSGEVLYIDYLKRSS